jgi:alpha-ribazole phosphatase
LRLLLVRHGITQNNVDSTYTGQADVPLTELGKRQASAVGRYLAQEQLDVILSSDLQRALITASEIARHHHLSVLAEPDLREICMGEWEGLSAQEVQERNPAEWTYVRNDPINHAPTGGESFAQVKRRAARTLRRCLENYRGKTVLWSTHGGFIEAALCHALKLDLTYRRCFHHNNTAVTELDFTQELPIIERMNDTGHLRFLLEDVAIPQAEHQVVNTWQDAPH